MVCDISVRILADVSLNQPSLPLQDGGIRFLKLNFAVFGRLDFGPGQHDPGFIPFHQEVVMTGLPVVAQDFQGGVFFSQRVEPQFRQWLLEDKDPQGCN